MAVEFRIVSVRVRTHQGWQEPYVLDSAIVVIWGPVDTGKTSLLDAIAFAFGRDVEFRGVVARELREIRVRAQIGSSVYELSRTCRTKSTVKVADATGTPVGKFPVQRKGDQQTLSSWLAEQGGLEDALSAVRLPGNKGILTFADGLLPFCYLTQDDIDRQIIMPSGANNTRIAIFKLLMKVTTPKFERTAGAIRDGANLLKRRRDAAEAIGEFLDAEPATNLKLIDSRIAELTIAQQAATARVEAAHQAATAVEQQDRHYEALLSQAQEEWQRAEDELDTTRRKYERAKRQVQEYEEALASLTEQETRPEWQPGTINIVVAHCPYCGGRVPREPVRPGQCFMCGGLHRGVIQPAERATLRAKLSSAQQALRILEPEYRLATGRVENAKTRVYGLRKQRDERTRSSMPQVGAIADAEKELGEITGELQSLQSARTSAARIVTMWEEVGQLEVRQAELESQHELDSSGLTRIETLVEDLEGILTLIMDRIRPPHWTGKASIDPDTFLPVIDGMGFAQRGGGGRSAVSIAYSLALLTYTLENTDTLLPSLLMIDSPRKNFGASKADQGLSDRLYEQILDYLKTWSHSQSKGSRPPFQIIIADNDRQADRKRGRALGVRDGVRYHPFTEEEGFIRGLKNPHGPFVTDQGDLFVDE